MMHNILLSCVLFGGFITTVSAQIPLNTALKQKKPILLKDLDFKTVAMAFYQKDIQFVKIHELEHEKLQYVGVKNALDEQTVKENGVLIFSPAKAYQNTNNETRYLLTITKFAISGLNSPRVEMGKFEFSETMIYIFKKNDQGQFQLLSESSETLLNDDFVYLPYPSDKIIANIKSIGSKIKAYVEENEYSQEGYSSTKLRIMPFNDQPNIVSLKVAEIGKNNEATVNEKVYSNVGKYKFLKSEHDGLYDIEIKYTGTQRVDNSKGFVVKPMNETHIYQYNAKQQKYVRVK